jgi:hypothetical protein
MALVPKVGLQHGSLGLDQRIITQLPLKVLVEAGNVFVYRLL